jgi:hypothetical protein
VHEDFVNSGAFRISLKRASDDGAAELLAGDRDFLEKSHLMTAVSRHGTEDARAFSRRRCASFQNLYRSISEDLRSFAMSVGIQ